MRGTKAKLCRRFVDSGVKSRKGWEKPGREMLGYEFESFLANCGEKPQVKAKLRKLYRRAKDKKLKKAT